MGETTTATDEMNHLETVTSVPEPEKRQPRKRNDEEEISDEKLMEVYDLSKPIPRVERPDKESHTATIADLNAKITVLETKRDAISEKINTASPSSKADDGLTEARKELDALFTQRNALQRDREGLLHAQKQLRVTTDKLAAERKNAAQSVKYSSLAEINKAINDLQRLQSTTSMALSEEKKLLKEIDALSASKRMIATLDSKTSSMNEAKKSREELNLALDMKKKELDVVYKSIDAQRKVVGEINSKHDVTRAVIPGLVAQRNETRNEINSIKGEIRSLRDEFRAANNSWYNFTRAQRIQRKMQYEEEKKRREEEAKARQAVIDAEEAKKIPYEEEMGLCDYLVKYLEGAYLDKKGEEKKIDESNAKAAIKDDPFANVKPMSTKKSEDDVYLKMGSGKSQRKKNKQVAKPKLFELNIDTFEQFALLNLNPPIALEGVAESVEQLKAKKQWYSEQPRGSVATAKDIRKAMEAENAKYKKQSNSSSSVSNVNSGASNSSAKKNSKSYQMTEDDFVPLGANSTPIAMVNASWGKKA